jgi:hypothetical protein
MKTFAYVNPETQIVENVSVGDDDWSGENWVEYSSANVAAIGYTFRQELNKFIAPQPYPSWALDSNFAWQPPVAKPEDGYYSWDEITQTWIAQT